MKKSKSVYPLYITYTLGIILTTSVISYNMLDKKIIKSNEIITTNTVSLSLNDSDKVKLPTPEEIQESELNEVLTKNDQVITFYANTFQIDSDTLKSIIKEKNQNTDINEYDLFNTGYTYKTVDEALLSYLLELSNTDKTLFNNKLTPCTRSKEYILGLMDYFSKFYPNVDITTLKAIAEVESLYTSSYMLYKNNIYGGMGSNGLIGYKNIEYGVLMYLDYMNSNYYEQGLNTIDTIGYKFNPVTLDNGLKCANPTWVTNVTNALKRYSAVNNITIEELQAIE